MPTFFGIMQERNLIEIICYIASCTTYAWTFECTAFGFTSWWQFR